MRDFRNTDIEIYNIENYETKIQKQFIQAYIF